MRFRKCSHISCSLGLSVFQVRADFARMSNFLRFAFFFAIHNCCRFAVLLFYPFSAPQVFRIGFLRRVSEHPVFFHFCPFVQVPLSGFPLRFSISYKLAQFLLLSVLAVFVQDFGKTWQVCRSNSVPSTDLLFRFKIVEIFCQVLEGPPVSQWKLSLSPRVQHVEAALLADKERNCVLEVLCLFCAKQQFQKG